MYGMFTNMLFRPEENFETPEENFETVKTEGTFEGLGQTLGWTEEGFFDVFERPVLKLTSAHTVLFVCVEVISSCLRTLR